MERRWVGVDKKQEFARAFAMTAIVLWVLCVLFALILPGTFMTISRWWFHGLDMAPLGTFQVSFTSIVGGGVSAAIAAAIAGYIFGWSLETVNKRKRS